MHLLLDCFRSDLQADDLFERQHMRPAQVKVRVWLWEAVEVCPADGGVQQWVRLRCDDTVKT